MAELHTRVGPVQGLSVEAVAVDMKRTILPLKFHEISRKTIMDVITIIDNDKAFVLSAGDFLQDKTICNNREELD
jgi:hypothetical protein